MSVLNLTNEEMCCVIAQTLGQNCRQWFYVIQHNIEDWETFEREFRDYYWNQTVQMEARRKVHFGKYYKNLNSTRAQHVMKIMSLAKDATEDFDEGEFVKVVSSHFDRNIRLVLVGQRATALKELNEILHIFDADDKNKSRNNPNIKKWDRNDSQRNVNNVNSSNNFNNILETMTKGLNQILRRLRISLI